MFVAYQPKGEAEASAKLEVIDVHQSRSYSLGEVGDTGESNFDVNPAGREIVFNGPDGIAVMTVDLNHLSDLRLSQRTRILVEGVAAGWGVFWINRQTVGYFDTSAGHLEKIRVTE